jgi:hypothetical protein
MDPFLTMTAVSVLLGALIVVAFFWKVSQNEASSAQDLTPKLTPIPPMNF